MELAASSAIPTASSAVPAALPQVVVFNMNADCRFGCKLDLKTINRRVRNTEYNPKIMSKVTLCLCRPHGTLNIFASGRVTIVGIRSERDARLGLRMFARICQRLNFPVRPSNFRMISTWATADVGFRIRLKELAEAHEEDCNYEPEALTFAVMYKMPLPSGRPANLKIYASGKIGISHPTQAGVELALAGIMPIVRAFRDET